jgi:NAD(P)-dependent dehydrogenase (short-subunit alcohol dehydrogenase family)/enamine deaminase RidA (YjgF/YER057c/UK114 family)
VTGGGLEGKGAVVTGAGRGIGAAIARALAREGAHVALAARTEGEVEGVAAALRGDGAKAWALRCDVTREDDVRSLALEARERLGAVDILVNNAGQSASAPLRRITLEDWDRMLRVNATGTFLCSRELLPDMVARGWGRIVNIASISGLTGAKYIAHYCAAKHAVVGFTRAVAAETAGSGVTVNAVCPGYVDTPMTERTLANVEDRTGMPRAKALDTVLATAGQSRLIAPDEVAAEVVALCADAAKDRNGEAVLLRGAGESRMKLEIVNPESLGAPKGWNHGLVAPREGRILFVAGQAGWDAESSARGASAGGPAPGFVEQFGHALDKVLTVVRAAGGVPESLARMTVYVTDLNAYLAGRARLGEVWRARLGKHYPAMALVEVSRLVDQGALVEIEATAVLEGLS